MAERTVRKVWDKCMKAEEANRMLKRLVREGVWTNGVEAFSHTKAGKEKWANREEPGRREVCVEEVSSRVADSDFKVRNLKNERKVKTNKFKREVSHNVFRRKLSKILIFCQDGRDAARAKYDDKVRHLKMKYGEAVDDFVTPNEISEFSECEIFKKNVKMKPDDPSGPVIVCDEGEELELDDGEWAFLARGPKYCIVRACEEENLRVEVETAILKHKWDCMSQEEVEDETVDISEEERRENERVAQLAEEMSAQTRMVYNSEEGVWDARGLRVTDYKHNSRVIFPKAQPGEKENNLEVMRAELLHNHREWAKTNCNCKGEQKLNLTKEEQAGMKSIKKRLADGSIVILPTDKSGRFALMSMPTYIKAGMAHIKDDEEVGMSERRANQKVVNGAVSMLLNLSRVQT